MRSIRLVKASTHILGDKLALLNTFVAKWKLTGGPCGTFAQVDAARSVVERKGLTAGCLTMALETIMLKNKITCQNSKGCV
jgi:hypothetical protein